MSGSASQTLLSQLSVLGGVDVDHGAGAELPGRKRPPPRVTGGGEQDPRAAGRGESLNSLHPVAETLSVWDQVRTETVALLLCFGPLGWP